MIVRNEENVLENEEENVPRWLMDVAQSITKGNSSSVGMPKHRGLVPIFKQAKKREIEKDIINIYIYIYIL